MNECRGLKSITVDRFADVVVISPVGRVDHPCSQKFADAVTTAQEAHPDAAGMVVDLTALDMITSPGLQVLVRTHKSLVARKSALRLAAPNDMVGEVLHISHLDRIMSVSPTLDEAIAKLSDAAVAQWRRAKGG